VVYVVEGYQPSMPPLGSGRRGDGHRADAFPQVSG
jgi:hypothetical protein